MLKLTTEECVFVTQVIEKAQIMGKDAPGVSLLLSKLQKETKKLIEAQRKENDAVNVEKNS